MRIDRIRIKNYAGLRDIDWTFPLGPVFILFEDEILQELFCDLLLTLFYGQQEAQLLSSLSPNTLIEVWMSGEGSRYILRHKYSKEDKGLQYHSNLFDETGQTVYLPENTILGEYLFNIQLQAFLQGGTVKWPARDDNDNFISRINNLSQGGDEELSLRKMRASLAGAQKKVKEKRESMELVKAEYDALRVEWEDAHRLQEDERLLQIEIKNLREKETVLTESIAVTTNMQMRIELLSQNLDYRELRQLQDEINRLEDRWRFLDDNLRSISNQASLDWEIIESFREECMEWACLLRDVERLGVEIELRSKLIQDTEMFLFSSGYRGLREDEDLYLKRILEERDTAQTKLNKLSRTKRGLEKLKAIYAQENERFACLAMMSEVTEDEKSKITKKETYLKLWRSSNIGSVIDRILHNRLGFKKITEILSANLLDYYKRYQVTDYQEFTNQLEDFHNQHKRLEKVQKQMEKLQKKVNQETNLRRIVDSNSEIIVKALTAAQASDFSEWLNGWVNYQQKRNLLSSEVRQLNLELEHKSVQEKQLAECSQRMGNNLKDWGIPATNWEEVLSGVLKAASQLQERDEVEQEVTAFSEKFHKILGLRDMEKLSQDLEPLAEVERESLIPNEERQAEISAWDRERVEICQRIEELSHRLREKQKIPSLSVLEKNIEIKKRQWTEYENLCHALDDAQTLLELSWQEWQMKHEKILNDEKQWVYNRCFTSVSKKFVEGETHTKRQYFSYRMAVAQLALQADAEVPLFFSAGKITNEDQKFWEDVIQYLEKISIHRQVIFSITEQVERLSAYGWSSLDIEVKDVFTLS